MLKKSAFLGLIYLFDLDAVNGQSRISNEYGLDTIRVLNGRLEVVMKADVFHALKTDSLFRMYSVLFDKNKASHSEVFAIGKEDTLSFYQTSIDKPTIDDDGLSIWTIIQSFTDKIPDNLWIENGWNKTKNDYMYYVKMISSKKPEQFFKFDFFFIDNKLAFSLFQHPIIENTLNGPENYIIVSAIKSTHLD